jgi:hypothetical protein
VTYVFGNAKSSSSKQAFALLCKQQPHPTKFKFKPERKKVRLMQQHRHAQTKKVMQPYILEHLSGWTM